MTAPAADARVDDLLADGLPSIGTIEGGLADGTIDTEVLVALVRRLPARGRPPVSRLVGALLTSDAVQGRHRAMEALRRRFPAEAKNAAVQQGRRPEAARERSRPSSLERARQMLDGSARSDDRGPRR